jgi:hypothetical protein
MPLDLIVGAAVGAAVASPSARKVIRRGVVYGLAGILVAYDKVAKVTHAVVREAGHEATPPASPAPAEAAAASPPTST